MKYQVTIYNPENKYKPISTIVDMATTDKQNIIKEGVTKICIKKYWTKNDLTKWGYTKVRYREYTEG